MVRLREIKKYGNTNVITLKVSDMMDLNLKIGDMVDIEEILVKTKKGGNKK